MQFLSDLLREMPGLRRHALLARRRGRSRCDGKAVHEVLDLTVAEATGFSGRRRRAAADRPNLQVLADVGLGYLKLGQPLNTLSRRRKPAAQAGGAPRGARRGAGGPVSAGSGPRTDEPKRLRSDHCSSSTNRRPACISTTSRILLTVFHRLVEAGHSLLVIEHNLDVIKNADWVIDLGPGGGSGRRRASWPQGTPEAVARGRGVAHRAVSCGTC